jgi:regulatory protein
MAGRQDGGRAGGLAPNVQRSPGHQVSTGSTAAAAATARALELSYRYLNRRERTVHELRSYLAAQDLDVEAVQATVTELVEVGALDDARYARLFAQDKRELESWGTERIRRALLGRGIEAEVLEQALAGNERGHEQEFERAVALLRQRFPDPPRARRDRERALGLLVRRGYGTELAIDAISAYRRDDV